jgi:hypothetical protein
MSKRARVPVDIQFLLESVLAETPDTVIVTDADKQKFDAMGIPVEAGEYSHKFANARPFFVAKDGVILYTGFAQYHSRMDSILRNIIHYAKTPELFKDNIEFIKDSNGVGLYSGAKDGVVSRKIYFHGLNANNLEDIRQYLSKHNSYFRGLDIRGSDPKKESVELSGRLWINKNIISFWNSKDELKQYMNNIFDFMKFLGMDVKKSLYEFIDSKGFWTYDELTGKAPESKKEKLTPEEIKILQKIQHLDPKAKKELWLSLSPDERNSIMQKAGKGFDYPAKADASMPALERHIKLKDLI